MYELKIAWRNLFSRPLQSLITILVIGLAVALAVTVSHLNEGLQRGIIRASDPFGVLVVGAKGSSQQLGMSTLLLQGAPIGNISGRIFQELRKDPRVALAVPIAMGDNVGGARIIGTDEHFFELRPSLQDAPAFRLAEGRYFATDFEAVLGSRAAAELRLAIGDRFRPQHGVTRGLESDTHAEVHTVVGILQPSNTPFDKAVLTRVESVIDMHAEEGTGQTTQEDNASEALLAGDTASVSESGTAKSGEHAGAEEVNDPGLTQESQVTAILVQPVGFIEANELWREFYVGAEAQAVFPGRELGSLFDLLNQGQQILIVVGYLAAVMAALTLFLAIYSATESRQHVLAILRGVGAGRSSLVTVVLVETVLMALLGTLFGRLLGYAAAASIAAELTRQSAIPIEIDSLGALEPLLWLLPLGLGVLAGLLPAWQAYRVNVVAKLFLS